MEKNPNLNEESGNKALYFTDAEFKYEKTEVEKSLQKYGIDNPIVSFETLFKCNAYMTQKGKY
jgi:hypothetical protein